MNPNYVLQNKDAFHMVGWEGHKRVNKKREVLTLEERREAWEEAKTKELPDDAAGAGSCDEPYLRLVVWVDAGVIIWVEGMEERYGREED